MYVATLKYHICTWSISVDVIFKSWGLLSCRIFFAEQRAHCDKAVSQNFERFTYAIMI